MMATTQDDKAHGMTFAVWLTAAGRSDSASEYDLRAAWRAGEDPAEYQTDDDLSRTYTYSIYDVDPATGGRAWSSHDDVEIEAADAEEALSEAYAEARCVAEPGDRVWVYVWDRDGTVAESGSITIEDE